MNKWIDLAECFKITDEEPNWKSVAENFWYAGFHGDNDLMEHMIERYTDWFDEDDADVE